MIALREWSANLCASITRKLPLAEAIQVNGDDDYYDKKLEGQEQEHTHLKKCLGLGEVVTFGISNTVGSGIFVVVGSVAAQYSGSGLFISMLMAVLVSLLSAFCFAELAAKIPAAGQVYTYTYVCMGELIGFLSGWLTTIPTCTKPVHPALGYDLPSIFYGASSSSSSSSGNDDGLISISLLGPILCALCTIVSLFGVKESASLSYIMACINCAVLIGISIYGAIRFGDLSNFTESWPNDYNGDGGISGVLRGSGLAFFSCVGWDAVCTLSEEVRDSKRDIPRGIMGTLCIVALLYGGLSLSFSFILPVNDIDLEAPLAAAFLYHDDFWGYIAVSLAATTVCVPSVMAGIVSQPRIWYRMSLDGLLFRSFARLNTNDIPVVGTVVCGIMAALLSGILQFDSLAGMVSFSSLMLLTLVCCSLIIIRVDTMSSSSIITTSHPSPAYYLRISLMAFVLCSIAFHYVLISLGTMNHPYVIAMGLLNLLSYSIIIFFYRREAYSPSPTASLTATAAAAALPVVSEDDDELTRPLIQTPGSESRSTVASEYDLALLKKKRWGDGQYKGFLCPLIPYIPLLAVWINSYLMASLGVTAILFTAGWLTIGTAVYFAYGQGHSLLND
ncbi:hypothetical protein FOZ61_009740 [Perkinsus olseni]|uniref:Cationic amino acid transporter C-terminal domain-containing protein n=1 Tax=Perkinsus olseni TaxID=32597 RepID=A0A7J6L0K0_PEROL|nr:hypothetical protein FOZ61_009740 [Perkinsus olseni]